MIAKEKKFNTAFDSKDLAAAFTANSIQVS